MKVVLKNHGTEQAKLSLQQDQSIRSAGQQEPTMDDSRDEGRTCRPQLYRLESEVLERLIRNEQACRSCIEP